MSESSPASSVPISARSSKGGSVTYVFRHGRTITMNGNRPYRDNNPGNLRFPGRSGLSRARRQGGIGLDKSFAIFPTVSAGKQALDAMIQRRALENQTLLSFLTIYAPPGETNTAAYVSVVAGALGAKPSDLLSALTDQHRSLLAQTSMMQEGGSIHGHQSAPPTTTPTSKPRG